MNETEMVQRRTNDTVPYVPWGSIKTLKKKSIMDESMSSSTTSGLPTVETAAPAAKGLLGLGIGPLKKKRQTLSDDVALPSTTSGFPVVETAVPAAKGLLGLGIGPLKERQEIMPTIISDAPVPTDSTRPTDAASCGCGVKCKDVDGVTNTLLCVEAPKPTSSVVVISLSMSAERVLEEVSFREGFGFKN